MSAYEDDELPQLDLRKFDFNMFKPDRVVMLVGKRGTGKSVLLRDLLSHLSCEYDGGVAMSPTPESTDMFREFMPDSCVYEDYTSEKIAEIVLKLREFNGVGIYKRVFVLLDDCMFDSKILKSIQMRDIHMNGRTPLLCPFLFFSFFPVCLFFCVVSSGLRVCFLCCCCRHR
ncbi:AAA ATPase incomplete domain containing protein [Pandoravirus macleodensis]|uniref:AAA ATPase incomplete domain containing protein n=1 Tax=Pandoravirus macleodensis TaxID=2107707 RepID=A0A2U7UF44_9VIRU|nr:AAA ATPase incomplete domain containing protein [Pandoravirus macleodensis]AVK76910.1 AAA ATPase incomplete domain containing protein [Pandoravirus macleodensis]UMO79527.1 AAA ATPase incomplete domain containing protein [Pandoravirus aubagnensis]